jgi:hypothetical protein
MTGVAAIVQQIPYRANALSVRFQRTPATSLGPALQYIQESFDHSFIGLLRMLSPS